MGAPCSNFETLIEFYIVAREFSFLEFYSVAAEFSFLEFYIVATHSFNLLCFFQLLFFLLLCFLPLVFLSFGGFCVCWFHTSKKREKNCGICKVL